MRCIYSTPSPPRRSPPPINRGRAPSGLYPIRTFAVSAIQPYFPLRTITPQGISPFSFNPTSWSFHPSHLGNSSELKRVFFLVARQRLSKLIFTLTPASVDCTRFGVGSPFSFPISCSFPKIFLPLHIVGWYSPK